MSRPFTRRAFIASLACATSAAAASVMTACSKTGKGASAEQTAAFPDVIPLREGREEAAYNSSLLQQAIDDASKKGGSVHLGPGTFYFAWTKATDEGNCVVEMRDNVEVRGSGKDATILKPLGRYAMTGEAPHGIDMFYYDGFDDRRYLDNASFYDFTIDGESTQGSLRGYNASGKGFFFKLFRGCTWERVEVRNTDGTGFGADYPVDCVMRDCSAIGCGKNATEDSYGASGFGVGVGFSEDESMVIENCTSSANTKFGFFFEHQSLYRLNGVGARRAKGFHVTNCTAWGNLINFGGNRAYDVVYDHCVSDQPKKSDDELYTDYAFTFVEHSVRILVRNATVDQMYTDVLADPSSFAAIEWALSRNVAHVGASGNNEFRPENSITRAEAAEFFWRYAGRPGMLPCVTITLTTPRVTSAQIRFALTRCGGWKTMKLRRGTTSAPKMRSPFRKSVRPCCAMPILWKTRRARRHGRSRFRARIPSGKPLRSLLPRKRRKLLLIGLASKGLSPKRKRPTRRRALRAQG